MKKLFSLFNKQNQQVSYKIIIPQADNDGREFSDKVFDLFIKQAVKLGLNGGTFYKPSHAMQGFWSGDDGKVYFDNNGYFETIGNRHDYTKAEQLAHFAKKLFKQEAIYFEAKKTKVNFI